MNFVIDTNIFLSALIKDGLTREIIINSPFNLFIPEQELIEIKKYEELIINKSYINKEDLRDLIRKLLKYITILRNDNMAKYKCKAENIIGKIDNDDVPFVAAALFLNCPIWSEDKHFQKQKEIKIFTTNEILKIYNQI
ncbi:MAG: PIN domain-containing protein [Nanoarchaeota archaeon]